MVRTDLYLDPENQCIVLRCIDENGAVIKTLPQVRIALADLQYADQIDSAHAIESIFRRVHYPDSRTYSKKRCYGLFTAPESDATDDGKSSSVEDLYLGGGAGGGLQMAQISSLYVADYFGVKLFDGTTLSPTEFLVAKSIPSRMSAGANDYGNFSFDQLTDDNHRRSFDGSSYENQVMLEPFNVGDTVFVAPLSHTGVSVSGSELTYIEINTLRSWHHPCGTATLSGISVLTP